MSVPAALTLAAEWVVQTCHGSHVEGVARRFSEAVATYDGGAAATWHVLEAHRELSGGLDRIGVRGQDRTEFDAAVDALRVELDARLR